MKKNVSKWLSALLALCLLCAALPLGGVMAATTKTEMTAADNRISNGDFECWKNNGSGSEEPVYWHGGTFAGRDEDAYAIISDANGTASHNVYQTIAVDSGVSYKLTFQAKANSGNAFTVSVADNNDVKALDKFCVANGTWNQYVCLFTYEGSLQEAELRFAINDTATEIWIDDVTLDCETDGYVENLGVSYDGYIIDGDFESGSMNYWTVSGGEVVAFDGDYALKATTTSRYNTVAAQTITVEANTDYTLDVKSYYNGSLTGGIARVHIYAGTSGSTELAKPSYYWNITAGSWDNHQLTFNSGDNTQVRIVLQQHAAPNSSTAMDGNIYYDDFVVKKVVADDNVVNNMLQNGGFEVGTVGATASDWKQYDASYPSLVSNEDVHAGNQSIKLSYRQSRFVLYQDVTVEANTDYTVTLYYRYTATSDTRVYRVGAYTTSSNGNVGTGGGTLIDSAAAEVNTVITNTEWTQLSYSFNSGDNTTVRIGISGISSSAKITSANGFTLVDDIVMTGPDNGGDSGDSGETPVEPEVPTLPDVNTGYYFYSNQAYQTIQEVDLAQWVDIDAQAGKTYKITFSARAVTNGFRLYINDETNNDLFWGEDIRSWQTIEIYHRISASEMKIELRNLGNAGVETNLYIDLANITVEEIPDTEVNLITHNGKSAMEMDDTGLVGGLAFKYSVNMLNAQTTEPDGIVRRYIEGTASAYPFTNDQFPDDPYEYTVLRVGSIMTFDATQVNNMTVESANPNTPVINIVGEKRMAGETSADTYTFAVRIINIPERHFDTVIYSRPYITVQAGDRIVTLYGETQSESYNGIMLS